MAHDGLEVGGEADVRRVDDEVGDIRGNRFARIPCLLELPLNAHEPALEFAVAAGVRGRERAEHPGSAGRHHKLGP